MALYVLGEVLKCRCRDYPYNDKKTGEARIFKSHRCLVFDKKSNGDPVAVDTGEISCEVGKHYRIAVYASLYTPEEGGKPVIQYKAYKDDPPFEYNPNPKP